jgi:hypothetical protein
MSRGIGVIFMLLLLAGGILALSGLIVAKRPDARRIIDQLVPFQVVIGVALLAMSLYVTVKVGPINMVRTVQADALVGGMLVGGVVSGIALGIFFGMPQIAKWLPGQQSEQKATELAGKLAPFTMLAGVVAVGAAALMLLWELGLLKYLKNV